MNAGADASRLLRTKLLLLIAGPAVVALATRAVPLDTATESAREERRLRVAFSTLVELARDTAAAALADSPSEALGDARRLHAASARRLEGVAVFGPDLELEGWAGTPAEVPLRWLGSGAEFVVRDDGVRTRLLARAGPDADRRRAVASLIVDSTLDDLSFHGWLPPSRRRSPAVEVAFGEAGPLPARAQRVTLGAPDGTALGVADLVPRMESQVVRRARAAGRAWAALTFAALLALLFDWRELTRRTSGRWLAATAVVLGRLALVWQSVPGELLPRELGTASVYGSSRLWGLLESPADFLLTGLALHLLCLTLCGGAPTLDWRNATRAALGVGAAGGAVTGLALSLARNSRVALLARPAPFEWDARLALWLGLAFAILGGAECWAALLRRRGTPAAGGTGERPRLHVALAVVVLSAGAALLLEREGARLAMEALRSEIAPEVLNQSARRAAALEQALAEIVADVAASPARGGWPGTSTEFLAYRTWVRGELFHSRYKSSIDFYSLDGQVIDHFGFGIPPLAESIPSPPDAAKPKVRGEYIQVGPLHVLHAEATLEVEGRAVGVVAVHALDEPDNVPFLLASQPYQAALGPGLPHAGAEMSGAGVEYVLYDPSGGVQLTTLLQPPAETDRLCAAAAAGTTVVVEAGDGRYRGLALQQPDGALHLLLVPSGSLAERLGTIVRLSLLVLLVLVLLALVRRGLGPLGWRGLGQFVRASFYRKLVAALLLASIVPLVGLALFLRAYLERRGDAALVASATQFVSAAQRVIEDYSDVAREDEAALTDGVLYWLRRIVGQEIQLFRDGRLVASSTRELYDSGLLPPRLDGEVERRLVDEGLPYVVAPLALGPLDIPVAYAPVRESGPAEGGLVVAVPLVLEERQIARAVSRVAEMTLLATVALVGLLACAAALLARTVARPVRDLVGATGRIAAGDYGARLVRRTHDEVAELVDGFNAMAHALATQRAALEQRREYIEALLRHATIGVLSLDTAGRVVTLNPAARQLLAAARLESGVELERALVGSRLLDPLAAALARARAGESVEVDLAGPPPRRLRGVSVDLTGPEGSCTGRLILLEDVTELMRSNQLAAWAEMARAIAHEIKNPLTPIQLSAEHLGRLLADQRGGPSEEERVCLETIIKQVRTLHGIAGEFGAYAKLPALAPEPTDPVAFMRGVIAPYRAARPPGITIEEAYTAAAGIAADPRVLSRAVVNLVENALQAMPDGGTLTAGVLTADDGRVELRVSDTGPGLAPEVRRRLFEPYFSTKSSGTGLGLAIARRAVEAHGGTIEVANGVRGGTTFRILLPALGTFLVSQSP